MKSSLFSLFFGRFKLRRCNFSGVNKVYGIYHKPYKDYIKDKKNSINEHRWKPRNEFERSTLNNEDLQVWLKTIHLALLVRRPNLYKD